MPLMRLFLFTAFSYCFLLRRVVKRIALGRSPARGRAAERDALDHPPQEEAIRERGEQEEPHQRHFCNSSSGCRAGVISARRPSRTS
ncbi:hypothetical protein CF642_38455 [Burkholderia pseudomallei]|nr:hypothetical protein CF642_38455 [Burkholderia pseudomallei]